MENKVAIGLGIAGICLGTGGLWLGLMVHNQGEDFSSELADLQDLVEKIQRIEESSTGLSANTERITRDVDTLRESTQQALNRVSTEMTGFRRDLNQTIQTARSLSHRIDDIEETLSAQAAAAAAPRPEQAPATPPPASAPAEPPPPLTAANESARSEPEMTTYVIRSGDTFSSIASRHGISLDAVLDANPDANPNRLQIGQEIRVPAR